ncbi:MAG: hypothetical protein JWP31_2480 [Aeromicrobium sp.]|nr:hypothetical protein [Aeromicrobium sp.]
MHGEEPGWSLVDDFFSGLASGRRPETVRRYARVRLRLYDFLDVDDMTRWLGPDDATLLAAEREFARDGAVRNLFGLDGLLRCLPGFVATARLPSSGAEARMQISVTGRLVADLHRRHLVPRSSREAWTSARQAAISARHDLEVRSRPLSPSSKCAAGEINARMRQQPGPQW